MHLLKPDNNVMRESRTTHNKEISVNISLSVHDKRQENVLNMNLSLF